MFGKKNKSQQAPDMEEKKGKPTPAYLRDDYPYKAIGEPITDLDSLVQTGVLYVLEVLARSIKGTTQVKSSSINAFGIFQKWHKPDSVCDSFEFCR